MWRGHVHRKEKFFIKYQTMYIVIESEMEKGWKGCISGHSIYVLATLVVTLHLQLHFVKLFKTGCLHFPIILIPSLLYKHPKKNERIDLCIVRILTNIY